VLVLAGLAFVVTAVSIMRYLIHHPKGTPFSPRYRDLIESYLAVLLSGLIVFGVSFIVVGIVRLFVN
jgi:hypothetical protein